MERVRKVCTFQWKTGRISYFLQGFNLFVLCSLLIASWSIITITGNSGSKLIELVGYCLKQLTSINLTTHSLVRVRLPTRESASDICPLSAGLC